jgi:formate dehydrogenase major subunit
MADKVNVILNGKNVVGQKGETILQLAKRYGIEIPSLCNDQRLEPYTSCYICVVEIEGMRGLQPACSTTINEGMKVDTFNGRIYRARKTALDLILSNHYADCAGPCKQTCPAGVDVQGYISFIEKGMYNDAVGLIKETNTLPAICGRVCVRPCEVACRRNLLEEGAAVGIDYLKRFASDYDLESETKFKPKIKPATGKKVAIIGAGPGGLSAAFFLQKEGNQTDIFEASPNPGGWLRYGIPEYRLPNDILDKEVKNITEMGVNIYYNQKLGDNLSYKALKYKYDAMILAIGSQKGMTVGCEGDDAGNVLSGIDFLKSMEMSGKKYDFKGKTVAVIGGGNTAMDCCRTSIRCGAEKVYIIYRRTEKEMPANPIEIHESKLEGVEYLFLTAPVKINKNDKGEIKSISCIKMQLGEPDSSGRRRPIPVSDSEFEINVDYALAAIGQKTIINFLDEVNKNTDDGELKMNKWGDIDADANTLQTGVPKIFAAGDSVTGPATLIQAIAQARIAARSCNQMLTGVKVEPLKKEFLSKRDNFKVQKKEEYIGKFKNHHRHEMPTLEPDKRKNFTEVELGYESEEFARKEAQRCLECGCPAYFICDLKRYATEYDVEQKKYGGEFKEYEVDFRHPYIEIDNNKCILCGRCVRICKEVVGANALGLINRGFKTFVAPSLGQKLQDTACESCGMCISTCPTGAISENFRVKPGPVILDTLDTLCNYCSVGCEITLHHKKGFVMKVTGKEGKINTDGNICKYPKFGYKYFNDKTRITKPLLKSAGKFEEIDFEEALNIIRYKLKSVKPDENAFFAGARLSNEEMYLIQKLARYGVKTNNVSSFHYLERGDGYQQNSVSNVPFEQVKGASKIYLFGSEINNDNPVLGYMIFNTKHLKSIPIEIITVHEDSSMEQKADNILLIKDYYYFIKAVNHYLLTKGLENGMFINDNCNGFEEYKSKLLTKDFKTLVKASGISEKSIIKFSEEYNNEMNAVLVFSEKEVSSNTSYELFNLAMITGKLGKTSNGLIALKEKNNSQGLTDMGISPEIGIGGIPINDTLLIERLKRSWKTDSLPDIVNYDIYDFLKRGKIKNAFVFGEDPLGSMVDNKHVSSLLSKAEFVVVQDYFMTETASAADLILPATFPAETGGTYTSTSRIIQKFEKLLDASIEMTNINQLSELLEKFGAEKANDFVEVMMEVFSLLPDKSEQTYHLKYTEADNSNRMFNYGCDNVVKRFEEEFAEMLDSDIEEVKAGKLKDTAKI